MSLFLEDFTPGMAWTTPGRTVTESDVVLFAGLSGDYNPVHTNHQFAAHTDFGRPIAHGLLALVMAAGLADRDGSLDGTALALLGTTWSFLKPVFFGDTIRLEATVESARRAGKGQRGIIVRKIRVLNQRDEIVQEGSFTTMVKAREP
jgi:acyl dehydratase